MCTWFYHHLSLINVFCVGDVHGFSQLALEFILAETPLARNEVLEKASTAAYEIPDADAKDIATEYLKVMHKIIDKGPSYVVAELARLDTLLSSPSIQDAKKDNFTLKRNILYHFDFDVHTFHDRSGTAEL